MDLARFTRVDSTTWRLDPHGTMRVPVIIYADEALIQDMDDKVVEQNVAMLPGIVRASYAMPDAHWGYGFPIGGVAAFDPDQGGVVSAGGVGFDISCGVRTMLTGLTVADVAPVQKPLADALFRKIPAGVGSKGAITLDAAGPAEAREVVAFRDGNFSAGTVVVRTGERRLYYVLGDGRAVRYPVGVGKAGKQWSGTTMVSGKHLHPDWSPPAEVKRDKPFLPNLIPGGSSKNPMGTAALTLMGGQYATHGTNMPGSVGGFVSYVSVLKLVESVESGCDSRKAVLIRGEAADVDG